jgi:hypothetical protein
MTRREDTPRPGGIDYSIPRSIQAVACLFVLFQLAAVFTLRGVADPQGYAFNPSKPLAVNTYEDDGVHSIAAVLGHYDNQDTWFATFFNIGGPLLHVGKALTSLAGKTGLVKVFEDPLLYLAYPEEMLRIWHAYGLYKLLFIAWLPIVAWWIGNNFLTPRIGLLAALTISLMPFIPAFEQRMKPDSIALVFGLISLLHQFACARDGRVKSFYWAAFFLGLSLSIKLITLPMGITLLHAGVMMGKRRSYPARQTFRHLLAGSALLAALIFCLNPLLINALKNIVKFYIVYISGHHTEKASGLGILSLFWYRLTHFTPLLGGWLNLLTIPSLAYGIWAIIRRRQDNHSAAIFLTLFIAHLFYVYLFIRDGVMILDYYFYPAAIYLSFLTATLLSAFLDLAASQGRFLKNCALLAVFLLYAAEGMAMTTVAGYLSEKTNRQNALEWIERFMPEGAAIGVFLPEDSAGVDSQIRVDPYRYATIRLGTKGEGLARHKPEYLLWCVQGPGRPEPDDPAYRLVAEFSGGRDLPPGYAYSLYQDEGFKIYKRVGPEDSRQPFTVETALNRLLRADAETEFNFMAFQALGHFPISLEMYRKLSPTVIPFATAALGSSLRPATGRVDYVHNIEAATLTLWGVKYILAEDRAESPFIREAASSPSYRLEPQGLPGAPEGGGAPAKLWRNLDYRGQAVFLPDAEPVFSRSVPFEPFIRGRDRIQPFGRFASAGELSVKRLEVFLRVRASGQADFILKGGPRRASVLIGKGITEVRVPYEAAGAEAEIGYEINPVQAGTKIEVLALEARPLELETQGTVTRVSAGVRFAFAQVDTGKPGRLTFALPYHPYWRASVNGKETAVSRGPANTTAVAVPAGGGWVSLTLE